MKIAIPIDEMKKNVCVSFGRAPFFLVHDTQTGMDEFVANPAAEAQGGAGIKAAQAVVDTGAQVLITVRCGENAAEVFQEAGIEIYKAEKMEAEANLAAFEEGKLAKLTKFHAGFHGIR